VGVDAGALGVRKASTVHSLVMSTKTTIRQTPKPAVLAVHCVAHSVSPAFHSSNEPIMLCSPAFLSLLHTPPGVAFSLHKLSRFCNQKALGIIKD